MPLAFLIIGQGLAGSLLAWTLMQRGQTVCIMDAGGVNASQIAAGLINPVTGMRLVKAPDTKSHLALARQCYQQLARQFNQPFLIEKPMWRLLSDKNLLKQAKKRLSDPDYREYVTAILPEPNGIHSPLGVLEQQHTGYLDTTALLTCLRDYFNQHRCLITHRLDYADISLTPVLKWKDRPVERIIFCQGHENPNNPWFGDLPLLPVKGEILTLKTQRPVINPILNYGHWLLPITSHQLKTGATFERQFSNANPTESAKQQLLSHLRQIYPSLPDYHLIKHQAGIRPTTHDRQPLIGQHPVLHNLYIFNGFGAKGSLLIPFYADRFVRHLLNNQPLPAHCSIHRHV